MTASNSPSLNLYAKTLCFQLQPTFSIMQSNLEQIKVQNVELKTTVEYLSNKYDDMINKLTCLKREMKNNLGYIKS